MQDPNNLEYKIQKSKEWIDKYNIKWNYKYDYSEYEYNGVIHKSIIICHKIDNTGIEHGSFKQKPHEHIRSPCPKCSREPTYVNKLLEDSNEIYYWIGFLMADGTLSNESVTLGMELSTKDELHLNKFAKLINVTVHNRTRELKGKTYYQCSISIRDKDIIPLIMKKYNFNNNKTKKSTNEFNN